MTELPVLKLADGRSVPCTRSLRSLPGKREVYAGQLDGRPVIAKLYLDPQRGEVHWQREKRGLEALHAAGIPAPQLLFAGRDAAGNPVILLEYIEGGVTFAAAMAAATPAGQTALLGQMVELLARHHAAGIRQTDLHLDNFLLSDGQLYTLDGGGIEAMQAALERKISRANLALLGSQLDIAWDPVFVQLAARYAALRDWPVERIADGLQAEVARRRDGRWSKLSDKIFRDCTAIRHRRGSGEESFVVREYLPAIDRLLADPDASCPSEPELRLKNGNTATVWSVELEGRPLVVKRYNVKNAWHGFLLALKPSRAVLTWRNAHRLRMYGIATPAPVACLVRRSRRFAPLAYFVAEQVDGPSLRDWVADHVEDPATLQAQASRVAQLFSQLRALRISHGDMKAANLIVGDDDRLWLIDLDAMRQHRSQHTFAPAWAADLRRFAANWSAQPQVARIMRDALQAEGITLPE